MSDRAMEHSSSITLFLCGDVMTGRGVDCTLPHPGNPSLHESYVKDARDYVKLAEAARGAIPQPVSFSYIWGDALEELERIAPDLRLINLETSVTTSNDYWREKRIHYRMHPDNIPCLTSAKIDYCSLANNHTMDWGDSGLIETRETLKQAKIQSAGAGENITEAAAPAVMAVPGKGRVIVFSLGFATSGIPLRWGAGNEKPGVNLKDFSRRTVRSLKEQVQCLEQPGDIFIASIHWGGNWGYAIPAEQRKLARQLIDEAGIDVIHGHSSHHVKGIEVYHNKPIIYGCGDFLDDYEGIAGYERFRDDLTLMYFIHSEPKTGRLTHLSMIPMQIRHFRANRVSRDDAVYLRDVLNREGKKLGTRVDLQPDNSLVLRWG
jgi:poly-gamma-glutamate synthesis protein (capsule biosynthesis protein)